MRTTAILLFLSGLAVTAKAQDFDEWFEQKKTQLSYLEQQIAALEAYDHVTAKGYLTTGLETDTIGAIAQQDFREHQDYFTSLRTVNSAVRGSPSVNAAIALGAKIASLAIETNILDPLLPDCTSDLAWLNKLISDDSLQMTDQERLNAIEAIYQKLFKLYQLTIWVCNNQKE